MSERESEKSEKKVVDLRFAEGEYKRVIEAIAQKGKCPFCNKNFGYHRKPILRETQKWFVTESTWPYEHSLWHFLIIAKEHKESILELEKSDFVEILELTQWINSEYKLPGGALCMRFGETEYTGSSVCHLHAHLIMPIKRNTVNFPVG